MSPVFVLAHNAYLLLRRRFSTAIVSALFLAAAAIRFAFAMENAEGSTLPFAAIWAGAVSPLLPFLAVFLAMDVWSEERRCGSVDFLLTSAVRERDFVFGKTLGVYSIAFAVLIVSLLSPVIALAVCSGDPVVPGGSLSFLCALAALGVQLALWVALSVLISAFFRRAAASAACSLALIVALPRAIWYMCQRWFGDGSGAFGEFPFDAQAMDFAGGSFSTGVFAGYLLAILAALFIGTKTVVAYRYRGLCGLSGRFSSLFTSVLAIVAGVLLTMVFLRLDVPLELPVRGSDRCSERTRQILSEASGTVTAKCFLPRKAHEFSSAAHLLRLFGNWAKSLGSLKIEVSYIDPNWDLGQAARLVRENVPERSIVFTRGNRRSVLAITADLDERSVASAISRVTLPPKRQEIYWTVGHGEYSYLEYGPWGMSDIARELSRDGYRNLSLDLSSVASIPSDCALIIIAAARQDFSRVELDRLAAYLKNGGRLLVLDSPPGKTGVSSFLPSWGLRTAVRPVEGASTLSGSDVIVSEFADHPVSEHLTGARIVLERPLVIEPSAATGEAGADNLVYTPLASVGKAAVVAGIERGAKAGEDIAVRPTRIVVIGDGTFAVNTLLENRANANRDFFLNAVAYLAGTETAASGGSFDRLYTGLDREGRRVYLIVTALVTPLVFFVLLSLMILRRRFCH